MMGKPNASKRKRTARNMQKMRKRKSKREAERLSFARKYRMCWRKLSYPTEMGALKASMMVRERYGSVQYPYECPLCGKWHLTSHKPQDMV